MSNTPTLKTTRLTLTKTGATLSKGAVKPNFDTLLGAHPADIPNLVEGIDPSGDMEDVATREIGAIAETIAASKREMYDTFRATTSPDFYVLLCFQTPDQRDTFVEQAGWGVKGDRFLDGLEIAARLGIDIQPIALEPKRLPRVPRLLRKEE